MKHGTALPPRNWPVWQMSMKAQPEDSLVIWEIQAAGYPLPCAGIACWPGPDGHYELMASGCTLPPEVRPRLSGRIPVTLLVGPSSDLARVRIGWARFRDIREETGPGFQIRMSVELDLRDER